MEDQSQGASLYRLLLDPKNLAESFKVHIRPAKEDEAIIEWRQVSVEVTVIMQRSTATVSRIDAEATQFTLSVI